MVFGVEIGHPRPGGFLGEEREGEDDEDVDDAAEEDAAKQPEDDPGHAHAPLVMEGMVSLSEPKPEKAVVS
ncbi:hypothetical protein D3C72_2563210 [compost metagenome]